LHGPTIAINTACSSGLVALHQAAMSLRAGECESALVASVALSLAPRAWVKMSEAGMISPDGECFSFANRANGIGVGEAVVVVMLKRLSAAIADGDHIYGVIKASGINFDGKTNGVTAPNGRMQAKLIEDLYTRFDIDPDDVSHLVAHGTGTRLGDPVELAALDAAFGALRKSRGADAPRSRCAITSSKSNFGHTMAASGLVSLIGLLQGLEHATIPASLHCEQENEFIRWQNSHFHINKQTRPWTRRGERPLTGAVSAFGRSGTNAHVVVEEYLAAAKTHYDTTPLPASEAVLVPLSARTAEQLERKARDLLALTSGSLDLAGCAYTLQTAREPMSERAAFVVRSAGELADKLNALLAGNGSGIVPGIARGTVGPGISASEERTAGRALEDIARLWVNGAAVDWKSLYDRAPARIALPTYPVARERYWATPAAPVRERRLRLVPDARAARPKSLAAIEAIIEQVDAGSIETRQAVAFLKDVV
jgi:polyketide synthase PksM